MKKPCLGQDYFYLVLSRTAVSGALPLRSSLNIHLKICRYVMRFLTVFTFETSIQSEQLFSTDDNGFEFMLRQSSYETPIEGNYYPTIYATFIRDYTAQLTVMISFLVLILYLQQAL